MRASCLVVVAVTALLAAQTASATHAVCPNPVDFAFMDLDGNLCHDPTDSGDVGPQLVSGTPFTPVAGSLVCSAPSISINATPVTVLWDVPGDIVLDCKTAFRADHTSGSDVRIIAGGRILLNAGDSSNVFSNYEAGDSIEVNADLGNKKSKTLIALNDIEIDGGGALSQIESSAGSVFVGARARMSHVYTIDAGADIVIGERAQVKNPYTGFYFGSTSTLIRAGGTVALGDRVKMKASVVYVRAEGDLTVGDRVKLIGQDSFTSIQSSVSLLSTTGDIDVTRLLAKATEHIDLKAEGGSVHLGEKSKLVSRNDPLFGEVTLDATGPVLANGVKVYVGRSFSVLSRASLTATLTNSVVKGDDGADFHMQTAPGGVCDVTGTRFINVTTQFTDCTVVGGP